MKKVYILSEGIPYEGTSIISVLDRFEKAHELAFVVASREAESLGYAVELDVPSNMWQVVQPHHGEIDTYYPIQEMEVQ